jgi:hypothetical protein
MNAQSQVVRGMMNSTGAFAGDNYADMAAQLEQGLAALAQLNEDAPLLLGDYLSRRPIAGITGANEDPSDALLKVVNTLNTEWRGFGPDLRERAATAVRNALDDFNYSLQTSIAENNSKLAERSTATAQRPMFKNWERRLIREELRRAATPQPTEEYTRLRNSAKKRLKDAKDLEDYLREQGLSDGEVAVQTFQLKKDAEYFAQEALKVEQYTPIPPVVRFADADTVALVEGWAPKLSITPGEAMDSTLAGKRLIGSRVGTPNDWRYTGNVRIDENGVWEAERVPIDDATGKLIDDPKWSHYGTSNISEDIIQQFVKREPGKFERKEHQGIYDRYNKEVSNYLKSLGGKQVKDAKGHGWWEVPVKPEQRRTQIFSMGGAAVAGGGAAAYNAQDAEATGAQ